MSSQEHHAPALGIVKPKGVPDLADEKLAEIAAEDVYSQKMSFAEAVKQEIEHNADEYKKQQKMEPEIVKDIKAVMPEEKVSFSSSGIPEAREPVQTRSDTSTNITLGDQRLAQDAQDLKDKASDKVDEAKEFVAEKTEGVKQGAVHLKDQVVEKVGTAKDFVEEKMHTVQEGAVHFKDQVVEKLSEWTGGIKETLGVAAEKTSETAEKAASTVKDGFIAAKDKGAEVFETTKEESSSLLEKAREGLESLKERVGSWLGKTEQKMEETVEGTPSETIQEGEVGRQETTGHEGIIERAKDGLESIKDTVVHTAVVVKEKVLGHGETSDQKTIIAEEEGTKKKLEA